MELIATALLGGFILILTVLHFLTHCSKSGELVNKIPGPPCLPIIGNCLQIIVPPKNLWIFLRTCTEEFDSIYKLWICHWATVNIRHPDDAEILLSSQKYIDKSLFYDFIHPWLNEGLLTSTGTKWRMRRKMLTPAFHFNVLQSFVSVFIENSEHMVNSLNAEDDEVVKDLVPFLAKYTLNVICETAMGTTLEEKDPMQEMYRKSVKEIGECFFHRGTRPWLKNNWIFSVTQTGREQMRALKVLHDFTNKIIKKRKAYHEATESNYLKTFSAENQLTVDRRVPVYDVPLRKKRLAMLDLLINAQKEFNAIDDLGIREEVDTFIFEGHDTTGISMSFAILLLAEHKEIQARARAEVDAVFQEANEKLGLSELQNLTYLDRCIKESLRLYPAVPTISRNLNEDMQLKKFLIPRGTIVNLHIYDLHRDPNFWPQPEVYDPDRFLPDLCKNRHPYSYIPFSAGPRNCIGQKFAMLELKAVIAHLLHNFYLEPVIELKKICMLPDLVLKSADPLNVKFVPIRR